MSRNSLIINSPFVRPTHHWLRQSDNKLALQTGRRPAGYEIFDTRHNTVRTVELALVNRIRQRVDAWREAGYPGVTTVTRQLLEHWQDPDASRQNAFYFCQIEAIETLIWHVEAPPDYQQGIAIPGDGGVWERLCSKMATGSGKTTVMAMIITWQVRVDSKVLDKAEIGETASSDKEYEAVLQAIVEAANIPEARKELLRAMKKEELLRAIVDNVGKRNTAGQDLQNVISVAMLSEGWDAKNVTHIMGLRAFTSQLLCEQVIGRGLRRVSYDTEPVVCPDGVERDLFLPEFVNVFGVPLSIFQDGEGGAPPPPPKHSTQIESIKDRSELEIAWPNVLRVDFVVSPELVVDWSKVPPLKLDPAQIHVSANMAPALGGAADLAKAVSIDLEKLPEEFRLQRLLFVAARKAFETLQHGFTGGRESLIQQLIRLVEQFFNSDKLDIPSLFHQDPLRKRILIALSIDNIVQHVIEQVHQENAERLEPVFDPEFPIGSTRMMRTWYSTKPCLETTKSQISHAVVDSTWEHYTAQALEKRADVSAYAKNDHLSFQLHYLWRGSRRKYVPDFLIRLANGKHMALEIKGEDSDQNRIKRRALDAWVRAVNARGGFGTWCWDVVKAEPSKVDDIIAHHAKSAAHSDPIGEGMLLAKR